MPPILIFLGAVIACAFLGAGFVAWRIRPLNRVGPLMVVAGLAWLPASWCWAIAGQIQPYLVAFNALWAAVLAHLVLAYPTGRLDSNPSRWETLTTRVVVLSAYAFVAYLGISDAVELAVTSPADPHWRPAEHTSAKVAIILALGSAVLVLSVRRWLDATPPQRRAAAPVTIVAGIATVLFLGTHIAETSDRTSLGWELALRLSIAAVPVAYLASLLRRRIDRAGVADLVVRLNQDDRVHGLEESLATALHDPSLKLAHWDDDKRVYVDDAGVPVSVDGPGRAATRIDRGDTRFAVLLHDPALLDEPKLIAAACGAAALALENQRLAEDRREQLRELAASRSRLVQAGDRERRRLERNLHDGVQQRLLAAAMTLGLAEATTAADRELLAESKALVLAALDDVRAACQGILPPVLAERGLAGALRELIEVAPLPVDCELDLPDPLPPEVESAAYYIFCEAFANAVKHAQATQVRLTLRTSSPESQESQELRVSVRDDGIGGAEAGKGTGLRGITERIDALGGHFLLESPTGQGTSLTVRLPCAS